MSSVWSKPSVLLAALLIRASLAVPAVLAADKPQSFTGRVTDAMCGANHIMGGAASDCLRTCIRKGSKYALIVGDKFYALDTSDKTALDELDHLADKQAKVTGRANGDILTVVSVAAAK
ncbi:MAG TPA: hypothetical protein VN868_05250 [Terriglobales bacterium]|jgi:hypothetical protein|nr:hypothetical protein [Terriglobales bacterium]